MTDLEIYVNYLKELNYPGIFFESDIANVFSHEKRLVLLKWIVSILDPDVELPQNEKDIREELANVIHEKGCCLSTEKDLFVEGSSALSDSMHMKIIGKLLRHLIFMQSNKENTEDLNTGEDFFDIDSFLSIDINLFPMLGPIQKRTDEERKQIIKENEQKIDELEKMIESLQTEKQLNLESDDNSQQVVDVKLLQSLEEGITGFKESSAVLQKCKIDNNVENCTFSRDFCHLLKDCSQEIQTTHKYISSMEVVSDTSIPEGFPLRISEIDENIKIVKNLTDLSNNLLNNSEE